MARHILIAVCLAAFGPDAFSMAAQQQTSEIRLIVQGDDMGAAHGINVGTVQAYKEGILRATNVLTPAPWMPEAAQMLKDNPGLDVGVHLTLTAEWQTIQWRPLTVAPSLVDSNGNFFRMVWPRPSVPDAPELKRDLVEIEKELRAQIELGRKMCPQVSYMSAHMGFASLKPEIRAIVEKLSKEYRLVMAGPELGSRGLGRVWDAADPAEVRAGKLAARLLNLGPGTYLTVEHCATDTPEVQAMGRDVASDRSAVVAAWTHPKVIEAVRKRGIKLTSYRDLISK